jgi:hypothetical protein
MGTIKVSQMKPLKRRATIAATLPFSLLYIVLSAIPATLKACVETIKSAQKVW